VPDQEHTDLLKDLGKFKMGKSCIYFKKLADLNLDVLEQLSKSTIQYLQTHHDSRC
jgi:hypothetical protein